MTEAVLKTLDDLYQKSHEDAHQLKNFSLVELLPLGGEV